MAINNYNDGRNPLPRNYASGAAEFGRTESLLSNRKPLKNILGAPKTLEKTKYGIMPSPLVGAPDFTLGLNQRDFKAGIGLKPPSFNIGSKNLAQASVVNKAASAVGDATMAGFRGNKKTPAGINWANRLGTVANDLAPYASNIANAFSTPADATMGAMVTPQKLAMPNYDATRADIAASESAMSRNADQSLDGNTAMSVKFGARAQTLGGLNKLAEAEGNARAEVGNRQASLNMYADQINTGTINQYRNDVTTRANTAKSAVSANLANAGDKLITARNLKAQRALDLEKERLITARYDPDLVARTSRKIGTLAGKSLNYYNG